MNRKDLLLKGAKIALGSTLAIFLCELLGLEYATSAGIITLLTIQDTRRGTLKLAFYRVLSFVLTMALGGAAAAFLGLHTASFGVFLLLMVEISYLLGWGDAVSTNAVFGTHLFLMAGELSIDFILNELALLLIGTSLAVVMNLVMPDKERELRAKITEAENRMGRLMVSLAASLRDRQELPAMGDRIQETICFLDAAIDTAITHRDNTMAEHAEFYINFFMLRKNQCHTLLHICSSVQAVPMDAVVDQTIPAFLEEMGTPFRLQNDVTLRLAELDELLEQYRKSPLPVSRAEFEQRAVLFHCLKEMEEFLNLKKTFFEKLSDEQWGLYARI